MRMPLRLLCLPLVAFLLAPAFQASAAETGRGQDLSIAAELDALTVAVNRLAALLEQEQLREQDRLSLAKLTKAIDYLNFRSRRIEGLERDLTAARNSRQGQEDIFNLWVERVRGCEDLSETEAKKNPDLASSCNQANNQKKLIKARMERLDSEIIGMENRLYELQNELVDVESFVRKNLGEFR